MKMGFDADKWLPGHLLTDIYRLNTNFVSVVHNIRWWEEYVFMGHPVLIKFKFSMTSCRAIQLNCCKYNENFFPFKNLKATGPKQLLVQSKNKLINFT